MRSDTPQTIYLKDYQPPAFLIDTVDLEFDLGADFSTVSSALVLRRNPEAADSNAALELDGEDMELVSVTLDDKLLDAAAYQLSEEKLVIADVPDAFTLKIVTRIKPQQNTRLEGLYMSDGMYCTQCEAEGFRRITYYIDRPDVMAKFTTSITADKGAYPILLSNGNCIDSGDLDGGRHWAKWEDPFKKPSYLFALVAGDLDCLEDTYTTSSGRKVDLRIYVDRGNLDKTDHAMASVKHAMKWDEDVFGLEYDLDIYMIVAANAFNMGAMENKGLNIFNSAYVLARPDTATDVDYEGIEGVIAHEYFHNWTGNRITCRDWFQLSLKEGLTVFRDQQFTADMTSHPVKRISDVRMLRARQFTEDAGPMAHPVRPDSYVEINNFYTVTVYEKGAEVVRMYHTLLGADGFRKGMDLYFQRHDGQAVTTDDFAAAMADANGFDVSQFLLWYQQAGTPSLTVTGSYDDKNKTYSLTMKQHCPDTPGQKGKKPMLIPVAMGLLDKQGKDMALQLQGEARPGATSRILSLTEAEQVFTFVNVNEKPLPSLLRGFSAPVKLDVDLDDTELAFVAGHDSDAFNRWDAGQKLAERILLRLVDASKHDNPLQAEPYFIEAMRNTLADSSLDQALIAEAMILPSEAYLAELCDVADPDAIHQARQFLRSEIAAQLKPELAAMYEKTATTDPYRYNAAEAGRRRLHNVCLAYLAETYEDEQIQRCYQQFQDADNMTDQLAAMGALSNCDVPEREHALAEFYEHWQTEPLVVNKWLSIQAMSHRQNTMAEVHRLMDHPAFDIKNPNKVRALIGTFSHGNPVRLHDRSGEGYRFLADQVLVLNELNPQIAARLVSVFNRWRKYDDDRQLLMRAELERILGAGKLSKDVYEIVSKALG
ncbi:MAG: aminopeptidase N [Gammaproteobacteria bacterium]|nr:aminopeptidase N [Gammaproteobacteria bacterium]